ncbi:pyruvate carboxylase [Alicyclobacillus cycloheptanicus]|uniref:Pyruvate carboxylase n=1 Tax=Alicyclobacillus cycloheptanicus TaxID=1457 RepID=A0ABT9XFN9_9BACL|nr:pyruvate carboxylase [Alicyclobacillus cycloheptanicus]MDQ0189112.1 pyruvate carboxylase [Alicyclobacillus cycloheptanicus]WDM00242.1 pyruvate carboxylase [Alicyclobacillus cycloheptanicus]
MKQFSKILVANRGEIAIRICRACTELGIRTVAIYTEEDKLSLHRYKADEAYQIGEGKGPVEAYLDVDSIIEVALRTECDAIHPGYGFLSESEALARACERAGITFIGPRPEHLDMFGDKVSARKVAMEAQIPVVPGSDGPVNLNQAREFAARIGYPVILKAVSGGGGRGMRVVHHEAELAEAFNRASSEAQASFGSAGVYVEKYIDSPKHIEVQILGDTHGNLVHLFERDCSIQRRHQKVVEIAPALIAPALREKICSTAVQLMKHAGYVNAGTVEFLLAKNGEFYFIEVNPRVQVEHTITELITGIDIVQAQIRVAEGYPLGSEEIGISTQDDVHMHGYAIQCRVTTEDPENGFLPDTGRIITYRSAAGFGIRLDTGNGFTGARVLPYYDSLLVKVSAFGLTFQKAANKMARALQEFRIRGVKTNIPFLSNVIHHPVFLSGQCDVSFIDNHEELFRFPKRLDRATKLLTYIADVTVNGPEGTGPELKPEWPAPKVPRVPLDAKRPTGSRDLLQQLGVDGFLQQVRDEKRLWLTDTTFRDAHQSLLATRVRTRDLLEIAEATSRIGGNLFSMEVWGGATFDASMRFLKEDPWERLASLREAIPNVLFQMLLRGANAVGYKNYPDNVVRAFVRQSAESGIDVFRIFDSLNWLPNMLTAIEEVRGCGKIAEAAICYTGDILDETRTKYDLNYYVQMAQELERAGAHILAIKDMAGLLKPYAAKKLVQVLRDHISIPIHLHTHDTSGNGIATLLSAAEAGVDIVDVAISSLSGSTSQPSWNSLAAALQFTDRAVPDDLQDLEVLADYWAAVRRYYQRFESGLNVPSTAVYQHEMPGGQYTNLREQAIALGIGDRFDEVVRSYRMVNHLLGDIVKVTPSSKMVGDFALFLVQNNLDEASLLERAEELDFPGSVVDYFMGNMGQPHGGFPEQLQKAVLKGRKPLAGRPGELLPPVDIAAEQAALEEKIGHKAAPEQVMSYLMYPQVTVDLLMHREQFGNLSPLDTPTFFYGMRSGEEIRVSIEEGKTLIIKLLSIGDLQQNGKRTVFFELNGQPREVEIVDRAAPKAADERRKTTGSPKEVGARMPGNVISVAVQPGDEVTKGSLLIVTEAMKMEMQIQAPMDGTVKDVFCRPGDRVEPGDLLVELA